MFLEAEATWALLLWRSLGMRAWNNSRPLEGLGSKHEAVYRLGNVSQGETRHAGGEAEGLCSRAWPGRP